MGGQEMKKVLERDNITIQENLQKVTKTYLYTSLYSAATSQYWISTWNMKTCFLELRVDGLPVMCSFHLLSCIQPCVCVPIFSLYFIMELQTTGALFSIIMTSKRTSHAETLGCVRTVSATPSFWTREETLPKWWLNGSVEIWGHDFILLLSASNMNTQRTAHTARGF